MNESQKEISFEYYPLRLVIMSATLRVDDFQSNERLFPPRIFDQPKCVKVATRQYPVETYFSKVTKTDYVEATFKKVKKIHEELPYGGILVFLTGKKEINYLCHRLKLALAKDDNFSDEEQESYEKAF